MEGAVEDRIYGHGTPVLEIVLNPGEVIIGPVGEVAWMTAAIEVTPVKPPKGAKPKAKPKSSPPAKPRKRAKEELPTVALCEYSAETLPGMVAFASRLPGRVAPIEVQPHPGMTYRCPLNNLVCVQDGVDITPLADDKELRPGRYGQASPLVKLSGLGRAWIALGGEVVTYELRPEETVRVHPDHLGLMQETVEYKVAPVKDVEHPAFGGSLRLIELTGPGRIWLQSLGFGRLATVVDDYAVPVEVVGEAQPKERGVFRQVLFPRP